MAGQSSDSRLHRMCQAALALLGSCYRSGAVISLMLLWLRAVGLVGQAVSIGGAIFAVSVVRPSRPSDPARALDRILALVTWGALLALTGALASHAAGRIEGSVWLVAAGALHQAAAATWVGGLVCATVLALRSTPAASESWLRPFSRLALAAVAALALTGAALSLAYIATPVAAIGTSYGAMTLTKIVLFIAMLTMGALNHRALHGRFGTGSWLVSGASAAPDLPRSGSLLLRRRLEVEAGLAIVTVFLAASIGSAPPAADVQDQRASLAEIRSVFTPQWPRLQAPSLAELAAATA